MQLLLGNNQLRNGLRFLIGDGTNLGVIELAFLGSSHHLLMRGGELLDQVLDIGLFGRDQRLDLLSLAVIQVEASSHLGQMMVNKTIHPPTAMLVRPSLPNSSNSDNEQDQNCCNSVSAIHFPSPPITNLNTYQAGRA